MLLGDSATSGCLPQSQSDVKGLKGKQYLPELSDNMCSDRVFIGRFGLNQRKKRAGLVSGTGHENHWPLEPKERWYFIGKCKPSGS